MNSFPVLETARLLLRGLLPGDAPFIFAIYSNPEVIRCCDMVQLKDRREAAGVLRMFQADFEKNSGIRWGITIKESGCLVGVCGISWYRHNCSALLSYDLNQVYWNRGIMTEAVGAVVKQVFLSEGVNRITATTLVDNAASIRVLQHVGFRDEGVLREWGYWKGEFKDLRCFSLLKREHTVPAVHREHAERADLFARNAAAPCAIPSNPVPISLLPSEKCKLAQGIHSPAGR